MKLKTWLYAGAFILVLSGNSCSGVDKEKQENAQRHIDQAFGYIGSLEAASNDEQREKLASNAEIELSKALEYQPDNFSALMNRGVLYVSMGKLNKAEMDYRSAAVINSLDADLNYNLACLYAVTGRSDLALDALDVALEQGFDDLSRLRTDPDLDNLRDEKEFVEVLERNKFFL